MAYRMLLSGIKDVLFPVLVASCMDSLKPLL